jgi:hypothetical protein
MWQSVLYFLYEWQRKPSGSTTWGIFGGFLLFLIGIIWKVPRERKIGLFLMEMLPIVGIVLFFFG